MVDFDRPASDERSWSLPPTKKRKKGLPVLFARIAAAFTLLLCGLSTGLFVEDVLPFCFRGVQIVDGDTVKCRGQSIRLDGFDTPEMYRPSCLNELVQAERATCKLEELVGPCNLWDNCITVDGKKTGGFGRSLGFATAQNDTDLATLMVEAGLAVRSSNKRTTTNSWCEGKHNQRRATRNHRTLSLKQDRSRACKTLRATYRKHHSQ